MLFQLRMSGNDVRQRLRLSYPIMLGKLPFDLRAQRKLLLNDNQVSNRIIYYQYILIYFQINRTIEWT